MRKKNEVEWVQKEVEGCEFGDRRLRKRFEKVLAALSGQMGSSLSVACQDWANTKAAYRFLANARVSEREILAGHFQATRDRAAATEGIPVKVGIFRDFSGFALIEVCRGMPYRRGESQERAQ